MLNIFLGFWKYPIKMHTFFFRNFQKNTVKKNAFLSDFSEILENVWIFTKFLKKTKESVCNYIRFFKKTKKMYAFLQNILSSRGFWKYVIVINRKCSVVFMKYPKIAEVFGKFKFAQYFVQYLLKVLQRLNGNCTRVPS